ncbi:histidine phosphatase family protein [Candidatus Falkowbacteria bacterium]|nr:histidine phosphatase family protein [Candidatus Falkowbacteria bacterium]
MKTGPYDPQIANKSKYESVVALGRQESDPVLNRSKIDVCLKDINGADFGAINTVYCSDLLRTKQTLEYLLDNKLISNNIIIKYVKFLQEIKFDIESFCTPDEYAQHGSDAVRAGFVKSFIDDTLMEKRQEIKQRCDILLEIMEQEKNNDILIISHTFFLKIFLIYFENRDLFQRPEIIRDFIDPRKRIMKFCEQTMFR